MSTPKPPKQLRVTLKEQLEYHYSDDYSSHTTTVGVPLGFAIPYNPKLKTFEKQMRTQDKWAYGGDYYRDYEVKEDGQYWGKKSSWEPKNGMTRSEAHSVKDGFELITTEEIIPPQYQPIIIDNVPLEGFRIQHMVARHRGNKLWRILDPRGFELEIASGCFEDIVMTGLVDKGLIIGPCIWQTGKKLVRV